jgi:hypothetical protein
VGGWVGAEVCEWRRFRGGSQGRKGGGGTRDGMGGRRWRGGGLHGQGKKCVTHPPAHKDRNLATTMPEAHAKLAPLHTCACRFGPPPTL